MKISSLLLQSFLLCLGLTLTGCGFKPMDHEHNLKLEQVKTGMSVTEVKAIFPSMKLSGGDASQEVYTFSETDYRGISSVGIITRNVTFFFRDGRLIKWAADEGRSM
ncbi:MAG: hypothetical protein CMP27_00485 [Roseibacillus sp.]|nr:hypothetical protein [Roseibacillus sp.]|tara:strand:+ start:93 stop:413 length:321 start_codon:yes stop_codon:yes gene_type:complete